MRRATVINGITELSVTRHTTVTEYVWRPLQINVHRVSTAEHNSKLRELA